MNLEFLSPLAAAPSPTRPRWLARRWSAAPPTRAPSSRSATGGSVAVSFGAPPEHEAQNAARTAGWADMSHIAKLELQGAERGD